MSFLSFGGTTDSLETCKGLRARQLQRLLAVLALAAAPAFAGTGGAVTEDGAHAWDFTSNAEGWRMWGTPKGAAPAAVGAVAWESQVDGGGVLRIEDRTKTANPYAISPAIPIGEARRYVVTGRVKAEGDPPAIVVFFHGEGDQVVRVVELKPGSGVKFTRSGDSGWHDFRGEVEVPEGPKEVLSAYLAIRPSPDYRQHVSTGEIFVDQAAWVPAGVSPLSLRDAANRGLRDDVAGDGQGGWTDQGDNDLRNLPIGHQTYSGVAFEILDADSNEGRSVVALRRGGTPAFAEHAAIELEGARFDRVYLLQTAAWAKDAERPVGYVVLRYGNGQTHRQEVWLHRHVSDWWAAPVRGEATVQPLRNANPRRDLVNAYIMPIENPHPAWAIEQIEFEIGQTETAWMILAATGERGMPSLESIAIGRDTTGWTPFVPSIRPTKPDAVSLAGLLHTPAGKHGHVRAVDGRFVFADGTPVRFWGTNIHASLGFFPTHEQAERIADTLARYGCNLVRFHLPEASLIRTDVPDRQTFVDEAQWEKFDYLIKCLKDRGIYYMLDSVTGLSARRFQPADGVAAGESYHAHKSWAFYDPRLQELGRAFMRQLLTHHNTHTGMRLVDDPALAAVVLINEQSVFWDMRPIDLPDHYRRVLTERFNAWLATRYADRAALEAAWTPGVLTVSEDPAAGTVTLHPSVAGTDPSRFADAYRLAEAGERAKLRDTIRFLQDVQRTFFGDMTDYARDLGFKAAVVPSNIIHHVGELAPMADSGVTSQNVYWNHARWSRESTSTANVPEVVANPLTSSPMLTESYVVGSKMAGAVGTSTENDTMWPHEWRSSHLLMTGATAAHQDLGMILQYAYGGGWGFDWSTMEGTNAVLRPTVEYNDPAVLSGFIAGAFLFLRGDVEQAQAQVTHAVDLDLILHPAGRIRGGNYPLNYLPFVTGFAYAVAESPALAEADYVLRADLDATDSALQRAESLDRELKASGVIPSSAGLQGGRLVSDTGEIVRDWEGQTFLVNSPRSQGLTGFAKGREFTFDAITITPASSYATILVSALDDTPLDRARRMFVVAVARADNRDSAVTFASGETLPGGGTRGEQMVAAAPGEGPVAIEAVEATIRLPAGKARLTPLNPDMTPMGDRAAVFTGDGESVDVLIAGGHSCWYLLERLD